MFIKRTILPLLEKHLKNPEVLVLTGFRRVGKSTLIKYLFDNLNTNNKLFLDMESPVNQEIFQTKNYDAIVTKLQSLGLKIKHDIAYVFMDEIQFIKEIPSIVKYLYDHYRIKFILTGSSSFYLKNHFTESLAGRKYIFDLMPLTFEEFLRFKKSSLSLEAGYDNLRHLYDEYLEFGGLPGVVLEEDTENKKLKIDDALGSYFQLDVNNLSAFKDIKQLRSLLFLLSSRVGSKLDITKLSENLSVSRQTLYNYIEFFEQTYLINLVPAYSRSSDVINRKINKLYFFDTGIFNRISKVSLGQLFENKVFNQLYSKSFNKDINYSLKPRISYFQKKSGAEIDFISDEIGYEVKLKGTKSDLSRLERFSKTLKLKDCFVVSLEESSNPNEKIISPFGL